jgi:hypothetical protein
MLLDINNSNNLIISKKSFIELIENFIHNIIENKTKEIKNNKIIDKSNDNNVDKMNIIENNEIENNNTSNAETFSVQLKNNFRYIQSSNLCVKTVSIFIITIIETLLEYKYIDINIRSLQINGNILLTIFRTCRSIYIDSFLMKKHDLSYINNTLKSQYERANTSDESSNLIEFYINFNQFNKYKENNLNNINFKKLTSICINKYNYIDDLSVWNSFSNDDNEKCNEASWNEEVMSIYVSIINLYHYLTSLSY